MDAWNSPETKTEGPIQYQIPTHLTVPDQLALPLLGFTVSVTMRQGLILLVGGSLSFHLWQRLSGLAEASPAVAILRLLVVGLLMVLTLLWTICTIAGRPLEDWLLILLRYYRLPRVYLWQPLTLPVAETRSTAVLREGHSTPESEDEWASWRVA
jgi:hypothetical protein